MPHHLTTTPALSTHRCDAPYHLKPGAKNPWRCGEQMALMYTFVSQKVKEKKHLLYKLCLKSLAGP